MVFKICTYRQDNDPVAVTDLDYKHLSNAIMEMFDVILFYKFPRENEKIDKPINMNCLDFIGVFEINKNNGKFESVSLIKSNFPKYNSRINEKIIDIYLESCGENIANLCLKMFGDNPYEFIISERCKNYIKKCVKDLKKTTDMENFEFDMKCFYNLIPGIHCVQYYERILNTYVLDELENEILELGYYSKINVIINFDSMRLYFSYIIDKKLVDSHLYILNKKFETLEEDVSHNYILNEYCDINSIEIYSSIYKSLSQMIQ
ncbi:hypothetical protein ma134 [Moumouvirus australiensis]|uniref:Uncharacterized protein n=1 Tax=Moumouvirus australiensis TaxID=2109587 RepID=A0A2P1EKW7_9VIRU|nr:hypothetical protein QKC55_gp770 [Moumouvirus australiensis]AVL94520.1 hypothetical protein ma134 [Moumouvirus australiensis]